MVDTIHGPRALGKRPPKRAATIDISRFLKTGTVENYPTADTDAVTFTWDMAHNDRAGCCVMAGSKHGLETITKLLGGLWEDWDDEKQLRFYQTQNPRFRSWDDAGDEERDGGMDIQTALETLVEWGDILAFGSIDHTSTTAIHYATWVGLAIITGEELVEANMSEQYWDNHPGAQGIGGHCTTWVAYDAKGNLRQVTWGELLFMTPAFIDNRLDEAWFILTQAHIDHPGFRNSFDLEGFAAAIADLTEGKVVVPVTPIPPVVPPVPPVTPPASGSFPGSTPDLDRRIVAAAVRAHLSTSDWMVKHFHNYFHLG